MEATSTAAASRMRIALFTVGALVAWMATGSSWLATINWDQGSYISAVATGQQTWSTPPWNAHFAIGQLYWLGVVVARALGGTPIDGFRLVNALSYGAACLVVAESARRIAGSALVGGLLAAVWLTSWVNAFLILSLEDNILYLPFTGALLALAALRSDEWSARTSVVAGALLAASALLSWQALLYLGPAVYAAALGGGHARSLAQRARDIGIIFAAFGCGLVSWCLFLSATSRLSLGALLHGLFSRPTGNFAFHSPRELGAVLEALGAAAGYLVTTDFAYEPIPLPIARPLLGGIFLAMVVALFAVATWYTWRIRRFGPHLLGATALLFTVITPFYRDILFRYLIRFDFLPTIVVYLLAFWLGNRYSRASGRRPTRVAVVLAAVALLQTALALRWDLRRHAAYPRLADWSIVKKPEMAWYGREGKSWFQYFRGIKREHPQACRYLIDLAEISPGSWNFDITAALWSELPDHLAIGDPASVTRWRYPPRVVTAAELRRQGLDGSCAVRSPEAARLLESSP